MSGANNCKAVFWDMEGVLVDTESAHYQAWQWLVDTYGTGGLTLEEYVPCVGHTGKENITYLNSIKHFVGDLEELRLFRYRKFEEIRDLGIPPIKENIDLLKECKQQYPEIRHFVVSSSTRKDIEHNAHATGVREYFESLISYEEEEGLRRKPAPDLYLYALKHSGLTPENVIVFEDSESGTTAATDAGLHVVAVPNKLTQSQDFSQASMVLVPGQPRIFAQIVNLLTNRPL